MIGEAGLTPKVTREIEGSLRSHELIKIRILGDDRHTRSELASAICEATRAYPVQCIGKVLVIYRPWPPEERKPPKRRAARKKPRKTKRSYQNQ